METKNKNLMIVAVVGVLVLVFSYFSTSNEKVDNNLMMGDIDQNFIIQMIPHHDGAIEMAKMALTRSTRPEIISLANNIIKAQEGEIKDMQEWYKSWFGENVPESGMATMHMGSMSGDLNSLGSVSDSLFDREFIKQMIPHHEMAIMMAQMLQTSTDRSEMKTLAGQIITSQSQEIEMMRSWLLTWYDEQITPNSNDNVMPGSLIHGINDLE